MVRPGDTVAIECTIPIGALRERYTVQWYKGLIEITNSTSEHIHVNENSRALVFSGVKSSDSSKGYYCGVTVMLNGGATFRQGSTITLHVMGKCMLQRVCACLHVWPALDNLTCLLL